MVKGHGNVLIAASNESGDGALHIVEGRFSQGGGAAAVKANAVCLVWEIQKALRNRTVGFVGEEEEVDLGDDVRFNLKTSETVK